MKRLFATIALASIVAASMTVDARTLTSTEALQRAESDNAPMLKKPVADTTLAYTLTEDGEPTIYVFSKGEQTMIVSADDEVAPILGYTDNGIFDYETMPSNMKDYLLELSRAIGALRVNSKVHAVNIHPDREAIIPLTTTKWGQMSPYNNLCPVYYGEHCVTGCNATALSQLMKYYNWPLTGEGIVDDLDLSTITFDYDLMLDTYDEDSPQENADAVAEIMYATGRAVYTHYGLEASSANTSSDVMALANNFRYNKGLLFGKRIYYPLDEWENMVYNELAEGRPLLYSADNAGGHIFIIDGYDGEGYYHVNWGWDGYLNGYFLIYALDGYASDQDAFFNVAPDTDGTSEATPNAYAITDIRYYVDESELRISQGVSIINYSVATQNYELGVKLSPKDEGEPICLRTGLISDLRFNYYNSPWCSASLENVPDGEYDVQSVYRIEGTDNWLDLREPQDTKSEWSLNITDGKPSLESEQPEGPQIVLKDLKINGRPIAFSPIELEVEVANEGDQAYYGVIKTYYKYYNQGWYGDNTSVDLALMPGETTTKKIELYLWEEATWTVELAVTDAYSSQDLVVTTIEVEAMPVFEAPLVSDLKLNGIPVTDDSTKMPELTKSPEITFTLTAAEGGYFGNLYFDIYDTDTWELVEEYPSDFINLDPEENCEVKMGGEFTKELPNGEAYCVIYYFDAAGWHDLVSFWAEMKQSGLVDLTNAKTVRNVEYYTITGRLVGSDNLSPGIYIKRTINADGSISTSKINIK